MISHLHTCFIDNPWSMNGEPECFKVSMHPDKWRPFPVHMEDVSKWRDSLVVIENNHNQNKTEDT